MAQSTIESQRVGATGVPGREGTPRRSGAFIRRRPGLAIGLGLLAFSTILVLWARTRPGFDPYGWLVWGHQTITASLDTNAAPSWKPLPYLFTVPFALAGHYQMWLWMITSVAVALSGVIFAGRIAYRLTAAAPDRRYAGGIAAVFAGLALLGIQNYSHYVLSAQSDPMIVSLCLGSIDCHLSKRPRWAFVLGTLAALGRPEVWPFLGLYALWTWRTVPSMRWLIGAGFAAIVLLWFGIPAVTSRTPFVAASNAMDSGRALRGNRVFGTVNRFLGLQKFPLELAALLSVILAVYRRDRVTLTLAGGVVAWVVIEIGFAVHGWPGLPRYMFEAGGVMVVIAAVAVGRLLADPPRWASLPSWAGAGVVAMLVLSLIPAAISRARIESKDLHGQRARTTEIDRLAGVVSRLGGAARLNACGEPLTRLEYQTLLAWTLHVNVSEVGFKYSQAILRGNPIVLFTPDRTGWVVQARHQRLPQCRTLP